MKQHVTVIPSDNLVIVDGVPLVFGFAAPANLHALQWHDGAGEMEWTDDINHPLTEQDYADDIAPFVALWEAEKARLDAEANRPPTLDEAKAAKLFEIKTAFAAAEADGFVESSLGFRADATRRSIGDIEGLIDLVSSGALPTPVTFRDYDNAYHSLTLDQLNTLRLEAKGRGPLLYARKWELEAAVDAAETVEAVQGVDTSIGWPGVEA
uniref:DUF4376 domain-containing protein n=1 Tax=Bilophila wadsworthia TaxID=35833 RepID=UPI003FF0F141